MNLAVSNWLKEFIFTGSKQTVYSEFEALNNCLQLEMKKVVCTMPGTRKLIR